MYTDYGNPYTYNQYPTVSERSKRLGATLLGGATGMLCYYLPVTKAGFINESYRVTKRIDEKDIADLTKAANEITKNKLSNESKIVLHQLGVSESIDAIKDKCKNLKESITDPTTVKAMKKDFSDNFKKYKKDASLMDTVTAKAMSNIKWNGFKWGMGIGAVLGGALSLLATKDR